MYSHVTAGLQLILSTALVAAAPGCSWTHPGANPYRGDPAKVLSDFQLPDETRRKLRAMLHEHRATDVVTITRDDIVGDHRYADLRDMHSGRGSTCHGSVDRSAWSAQHRERALVYCADDACVIVPTICNNVSLVSRKPDDVARGDDSPIDIEPAAGPPPANAPTQVPADGAPPFDGMPPTGGLGESPGVPPAPPGGGGGPGGGPADGGPPCCELGPLEPGGPGLPPDAPFAGGGPVGGGPPCCDDVPIAPGGSGQTPVTPPLTPPITPVPEAPAWASMLAALAMLWCRRRRTLSFRPIGTVTSIK